MVFYYSKTHVCDTKYLLTIQNSGHLLNQTTMLTLWLTSTLSRDAPDHKLLMSPLGCASYQKANLTAVEEFLHEKCIQRTEKMTLIPPLKVFSNAVLRFSWPCHVGNTREEVYPNQEILFSVRIVPKNIILLAVSLHKRGYIKWFALFTYVDSFLILFSKCMLTSFLLAWAIVCEYRRPKLLLLGALLTHWIAIEILDLFIVNL